MMLVFAVLLLLLAIILAVGSGLLCMLKDLMERNTEDDPSKGDPMFGNPDVSSPFSWQPRTQFRSRD
jgi:hypothetical protein